MPDKHGHFDHIPVDSHEFKLAHLFGCARFTLDVWEQYFGCSIPWHFDHHYDRLELAILPHFPNAQIGYGFMEAGSHTTEDGFFSHFCLNFDVIAHEIGHGIIYSQVGVPEPENQTGEYYGFHESAADLTAIIAVMHFDSILDELLENTSGNLYSLNRLNRIAELSRNEQIRLAANTLTMRNFVDGWSDEHALGQPLTGAIFDIFVDIFQEILLSRQLISQPLKEFAHEHEYVPEKQYLVQVGFDRAFTADPLGFKQSLMDARDTVGTYLARVCLRLSPQCLRYADVVEALINVDCECTEGAYKEIIIHNTTRRGVGLIEAGPQFEAPGEITSHMHSTRILQLQPTELAENNSRLTYYERVQRARLNLRD